MKFRHECKHEISISDMLSLRHRLSAIAQHDPHAPDGSYRIRSLYFDNVYDKALREKQDGVNCREKFRIRLYNCDSSLIKLEKKSKINGLCSKESVRLTADEADRIAHCDTDWMASDDRPLVTELYSRIRSQGLRPRTIVDYTREPFVFPAGNVRVTLDYDIRTGLDCTELLNAHCITVPTGNAIILEVKWDEFLPSVIRDAVQLDDTRTGAFSKYAACRMYG
ncbi:MAG: polyphosphate polymerase domain-containing protein [Ruminococcaceae bacterium]|nr:polyphosphate polymerase domain-containing protein [Oscillospiraceae bacterium]